MSLFETEGYQWRETYFVLFREPDRPSAEAVVNGLNKGSQRYSVSNVQADARGRFESVTVVSPDDFSAMDIIYVTGDEVLEHIDELSREIARATLTDDDRKKLSWLQQCTARIDIYHFEQVTCGANEEEEFLDPGSLIIVLRRLAKVCHGVGVDPQSGMLM